MAVTDEFVTNVTFLELLIFLFVILFTIGFGSFIGSLIKYLLHDRVQKSVETFVSKLLSYAIYAGGLYFAFAEILNLNVPASLAALGVLGIAILFPSLPVLQNFTSSIVVAVTRPFKEGDVLDMDGTLCRVENIGLFMTTFRAFDGKYITYPNLMFLTWSKMVNYSQSKFIRCEVPIKLAPNTDVDKASEIIKKVCFENVQILPNVPKRRLGLISSLLELPRTFFEQKDNIKDLEPTVVVTGIHKDGTDVVVWLWIWDILKRRRTVSVFLKSVRKEFKKSKIQLG